MSLVKADPEPLEDNMKAQSWTDDHSRLVANAAPVVSEVTDAELTRTWHVVRAGMENPPRRKRRKRRLMAAGIVAAVLAVPGGLAAADIWSARTGEYPSDAEDLRLGGPGERLDPAGPDFRRVIEEETADIPFPNEAARQVSISEHVRDAKGNDPIRGTESVTTGAIRGWTAEHATCSWSNEWVRAIRAGDEAARAQAARMLREAHAWPSVTDLDPDQTTRTITQDVYDSETGRTTTESIPDPTQFYYLRLVSQAVKAGDIDALAAALAKNAFCIGPSLMPDFAQALPESFRGR
jgi:hypothetical protein